MPKYCEVCGTEMTLRSDGTYICPICGHTQSGSARLELEETIVTASQK